MRHTRLCAPGTFSTFFEMIFVTGDLQNPRITNLNAFKGEFEKNFRRWGKYQIVGTKYILDIFEHNLKNHRITRMKNFRSF